MIQPETFGNNGNYAMLLINLGKRRVLPLFAIHFFTQYMMDSQELFQVLRIVQNPQLTTSGESTCTIVFTLNTPVLAPQFEEYVQGMMDTDITPFLLGSKITPISLNFFYAIPESLKGLATGGDIEVALYGTGMTSYINQVLMEVFGQTAEQIETARDMMELIGQCRITNSLRPENKAKFDYIMNKFGIKYELYK